jgi:hypothetical protein
MERRETLPPPIPPQAHGEMKLRCEWKPRMPKMCGPERSRRMVESAGKWFCSSRSVPSLYFRRALFYFLASDFDQDAQCLIDRFGIRKDLSNIGREDDNVSALGIAFCILAADALAEIVFVQHVWVMSSLNCLLHIPPFLLVSRHAR